MKILIDYIQLFFQEFIFYYALAVMFSYVIIALLSAWEMRRYLHKNTPTDYRNLLVSEFAPSVYIIAPAYNEEPNIVDNVRSLLSLHYNNYEVVVVNDGSKDDTLRQLIMAFELVKVDFAINTRIKTESVRGEYTVRKVKP